MDPILFTVLMVVVVCVGFYYTEKLLIKINFNITNEVLGIYFNVVGVLYTKTHFVAFRNAKSFMDYSDNGKYPLCDVVVFAPREKYSLANYSYHHYDFYARYGAVTDLFAVSSVRR